MMNSLSELDAAVSANLPHAFQIPESNVSPFEFRLLPERYSDDLLCDDAANANDDATDSPTARAAAKANWVEKDARTVQEHAAREATLRSATEKAHQEGRAEGERDGRLALRVELEQEMGTQMAKERELLGLALQEFRGTQDRYFAEVEQEVVRLALAIAARVLHREAHIDPLLLTGAVRVALEKMADRSAVVLRVAAGDADVWERALLVMQPHERPRVAEDEHMKRGECRLDTTMGTIELGVQVQLEEIEKGFFDLLNHRPTR